MGKKGRVICTGIAGFIGTWLVEHLLRKGYDVVGIDNFMVGHDTLKDFSSRKNFRIIQGDFCNELIWDKAFEGGNVDYVFHLGGIVGDPSCLKNLQRSFEVNVTATELCAKMCKKYGVKKLVFASSCSVFGQMIKLPKPVCKLLDNLKGNGEELALVDEIEKIGKLELDEESPTNPIDFYGMTKLAGERVIENVLPKDKYLFARFGTAFGLSRRMRFDLVINVMSLKGFYDGKINIFGEGDQRRPFTHCEDLARAMLHLAEKEKNGVFNVVAENFKIKEIAEEVRAAVPDVEIGFKKHLEDWRDYNVTSKKLLSTGFKFKFGVKAGIKQMVEELKKYKFDDHEDDKYYNYKLKY